MDETFELNRYYLATCTVLDLLNVFEFSHNDLGYNKAFFISKDRTKMVSVGITKTVSKYCCAEIFESSNFEREKTPNQKDCVELFLINSEEDLDRFILFIETLLNTKLDVSPIIEHNEQIEKERSVAGCLN